MSDMRNLYRAYSAVHNQELKQHIAESRDGFSDVNIGGMTAVDLQELAEEVLEGLFGEGLNVSEALEVVTEMIESASSGDISTLRVEKVTRIAEGFDAAFDKVSEKSPRIAVEAFLAYRRNKPLAEKWERRVTHEHGNERIHASIIAEDRAALLSAIKEAMNGIMYPTGEKRKFTKDKTDPKVAAGRKAMADLKKELHAKRRVAEESEIRKDWRSAYSSIYEKKLDAVGKEDADIDNDGDTDETDKYLHKRRKAIGKAMGKKDKECDKCGMKDCECDHSKDDAGEMNEEFDIFNVVLEFLQTEGYVDTLEEAEWMMANLIDEEAVDIILGEEQLGEIFGMGKKKAPTASQIANTPYMRKKKKEADDAAVANLKGLFSKDPEEKKKAAYRMSRSPDADKEYPQRKDTYSPRKEEVEYVDEADSIAAMRAMRERAAKRRQQRYGKQGGGGYDYYKPLTQADYERGEKNDPRKKVKNEEFEAWLDEAMSSYDRNRKRAAERAAARNAARDAGKTGVVPGVGYVSPRRERETYVDSAGTTRHKSGARMEEVENVEEVYKGKHGQSDKEYADSRSQGGKMVSGTSKMSGAEYTHGSRVKAANPGMQPDVGGKTKPKSQGRMDSGTRADLQYRKANLKKEEVKEDAAMSPQEIQLQKRKALIDRMIAQKRQKELSKAKPSEAPAKAMGEATLKKEEVEQIDEVSASLALTASQKADEMRRKAALAGDKETATKKAQQASRIYKGVGPRRARERMKEEVQFSEAELEAIQAKVAEMGLEEERDDRKKAPAAGKKPSGGDAFEKVKADIKNKYGDQAVFTKKSGQKNITKYEVW